VAKPGGSGIYRLGRLTPALIALTEGNLLWTIDAIDQAIETHTD
jgi:hypothetical protein